MLLLYQSCEDGEWVEHEETQVVQTAWAVIALIHGKYPYPDSINKGARLIMRRQLPVSFEIISSLIPLIYSLGWIVGPRSS